MRKEFQWPPSVHNPSSTAGCLSLSASSEPNARLVQVCSKAWEAAGRELSVCHRCAIEPCASLLGSLSARGNNCPLLFQTCYSEWEELSTFLYAGKCLGPFVCFLAFSVSIANVTWDSCLFVFGTSVVISACRTTMTPHRYIRKSLHSLHLGLLLLGP